MIQPGVQNDISEWSRTLSADLTEFLNSVEDDGRIYGFTLELPSDFSNDGIIARTAKCPPGVDSRVHASKSRSIEDDWEYDPTGFGASCDGLQLLYTKYETELDEEDFNSQFGDCLYERCLDVMIKSANAGEFGNIWLRFLSLSDDEHSVVGRSIDALNDENARPIVRWFLGV